MICRAACHDIDFRKTFNLLFGHGDAVQLDGTVLVEPAGQRLIKSLRLLIDLLQHEMIIAFLFGSIRIPGHMEHIPVHFLPVFVIDLHAVRCQHYHFIIFNQIDFFHVLQQSRNIRCDKVASLPQTCDQRRILADCHDLFRFCGSDHADGICPSHFRYSLIHCILQITVIVDANQMGDDLRIGFRPEHNTVVPHQHFLQFHIVFDNPVMNHRNGSVPVQMGMGIEIRRCSMGGPPGMADTGSAGHGIIADEVLQVGNPAHMFSEQNLSVLHYGNAGGIISPVFQPFQAVDNNFPGIFSAHISNYPAHNLTFMLLKFSLYFLV